MEFNIDVYKQFVISRASDATTDFDKYVASLTRLKESGCNISMLDAGLTGLSSESNEAVEILKKLKFQEKDWDESVKAHLIKELGDTAFYFILACCALGVDPMDVMFGNFEKLSARFPDGKFSKFLSENRKTGDI